MDKVDFIADELVIGKIYVADQMLDEVVESLRRSTHGPWDLQEADESGDCYIWFTDPADVATVANVISQRWPKSEETEDPVENRLRDKRLDELMERTEAVRGQLRSYLMKWPALSSLLDTSDSTEEESAAAEYIVECLEEQERQMWDRLEVLIVERNKLI